MNESILEGLLPNLDIIDDFLKELLPNNQNIRSLNFIEDVLKGNWVLEPDIFWNYMKQVFAGYFYNWKSLFCFHIGFVYYICCGFQFFNCI